MAKIPFLYFMLIMHVVVWSPLAAIQTARSISRMGRTLPAAIQRRFFSGAPKWTAYEKNAPLSVMPQVLPEAQSQSKNSQYEQADSSFKNASNYKKYGAASLGVAAAGLGGYSLYNYLDDTSVHDKNNAIRAIQALEEENKAYNNLEDELNSINYTQDIENLLSEYAKKSSKDALAPVFNDISFNYEKFIKNNYYSWDRFFESLKFADEPYKSQVTNAYSKWLEQNPRYFMMLLNKIIDDCEIKKEVHDTTQKSIYKLKRLAMALPCILKVSDSLIENKKYREPIIDFILLLHKTALHNDIFNQNSFLLLLKNHKAGVDALEELDTPLDTYSDFKRTIEKNESLSTKHLTKFNQMYKEVQKDSTPDLGFSIFKDGSALYQFSQALKKESQLLNNGYICFYHGQEQNYALVADISTELMYHLAGKKRPDDFISLRFRSEDFAQIKDTTKNAITEIDNDQKRLMQGPKNIESEEKSNILSLNLFAAGNIYNSFSSTWDLVKDNLNNTSFSIDVLNKNLELFGIPEYLIEKIDERFKKLIELNNSIYKTGHLILVAIPSNMVDDTVYTNIYASPLAALVRELADNSLIQDYNGLVQGDKRVPIKLATKTLHSMSEVVETLYDERLDIPFEHLDHIECSMPLTAKEALNPNSGIRYFPYDNKISPANKKRIDDAKEAFIKDTIKLLKDAGVLKKSQDTAKNYLNLLDEVSKSSE